MEGRWWDDRGTTKGTGLQCWDWFWSPAGPQGSSSREPARAPWQRSAPRRRPARRGGTAPSGHRSCRRGLPQLGSSDVTVTLCTMCMFLCAYPHTHHVVPGCTRSPCLQHTDIPVSIHVHTRSYTHTFTLTHTPILMRMLLSQTHTRAYKRISVHPYPYAWIRKAFTLLRISHTYLCAFAYMLLVHTHVFT